MSENNRNSNIVRNMLAFIEDSPSCYHAVENIEHACKDKGYVSLKENEEWHLVPGGKYYVNRNGSSVIAFHIPDIEKERLKGFHMVASHSDSPGFKIKEEPEMIVEDQYVKLNVEPYGGMIMSTWLDRPLSVAGRVIISENGKLRCKAVALKEDILIIPNVAIHMNRDVNKGMEYNAQIDMLPLYGGKESKGSFSHLIAEAAGVDKEQVISSDLFLCNRAPGHLLGAKGEFVCAPRLDDLECAYASMEAMLRTQPKEYVNLMVVFDNEEVGSMTKQGAASTFLQDTLYRICESYSLSRGDYLRLIADSFMISADNAHAVHPNHPEKADPTNRPYVNGGIVIKYHGGQKYTTDAVSAAIMKDICKRSGVTFQTYANRSDIAGGSTLGNVSTAQVSVNTVDIGLPQLAMHSSYETAGCKDMEDMVKVISCFYEE